MNQLVRKPKDATPVPICPCCGRAVDIFADIRWNADGRTLSGRGLVIVMSPHRSKIFDALWNARRTGRVISRDAMMDIVYADDVDGGRDDAGIISVQVGKTRKAIEPFGLSIRGNCGYLLTSLKGDAT